MELRDVARLRLRNQRLSGTPLETPQQVVGWLGAMQSQEYAVARWSVGQRSKASSEAALDQALADGIILRTHVLRPTWHFVLPDDIRWMMELTGPRVAALNAYWYRKFGLDETVLSGSNALLAEALTGGQQLTGKQVAALFARHGIVADGLRLGYLLMHAELDLLICSGALNGKLTKRFFTSHGPATMKDYVWWSSLTMADAKRGLEMVKSQLERMIVGDWTCWFATASPGPVPAQPPAASPTAHLLQGYDEYVIAYSESRGVLDAAGWAGVVPGGGPMFTHAVVLDGQVIGHWRRIPKPRAVTIDVQPAMQLDGAQSAALANAVDRYGEFVGLPATWFSAPPDAGRRGAAAGR